MRHFTTHCGKDIIQRSNFHCGSLIWAPSTLLMSFKKSHLGFPQLVYALSSNQKSIDHLFVNAPLLICFGNCAYLGSGPILYQTTLWRCWKLAIFSCWSPFQQRNGNIKVELHKGLLLVSLTWKELASLQRIKLWISNLFLIIYLVPPSLGVNSPHSLKNYSFTYLLTLWTNFLQLP